MKLFRILLTAALVLAATTEVSAEITFRRAPQYSQDTVTNSKYYLVCITDPGNLAAIGGQQVKVYKTGAFGRQLTLKEGDNRIEIDASGFEGEFDIYLNEDMIDFAKPVTFVVDGREISVDVKPSLEILRATTLERGDWNYQFEAKVSYSQLLK